MANALIAFGNVVDSGTLSGGTWLSSLPLINLQNRTLGRVARSFDASNAATKVTYNAGTPVPVRTAGIVAHNISLRGRFRVVLSNVADFSILLADSGWIDAWPAVYQSIALPWASDNFWSGRYSERDRQGYTWTSIHDFGNTFVAQYARVEIDDTMNAAGFIQVGRLFLGDGWQPRVNMSLGASLAWQDGSESQEAINGSEYFARRAPYRVARFTTGFMDVDEAMGSAFDIKRRMGVNGEVLFLFDPADTLHKLRRQFYGRLRELSPIEWPYPRLTSTPWEVKELI